MSGPPKKLAKLSIGDNMPTTRAQARRQSQLPSAQDEPHGSSSETSSEEELASGTAAGAATLPSLIRGASRITYDVRRLSPVSRSRAMVGLQSNFQVDQCQTSNGAFELQVVERATVHISDAEIKCSCQEYSSRQLCKHIYWILDNAYPFSRPLSSSAVILLGDRSSPAVRSVHSILQDRIEQISLERNWPYEGGTGMSRRDKVRDIVSAFEKGVLPNEDFRNDIFEHMPHDRQPVEQCIEQGDLQGTIIHLAVNDDAVFQSLQKVMPAGARATIFFEKLDAAQRKIFSDFDAYVNEGTTRIDGEPLTVRQLAADLREYVNVVDIQIQARSPHGDKVATKRLVELLMEICINRNKDAFEGSTWARREPSDEEDEDRNLFHQLIVEPIESDDSLFILETLKNLPSTVLQEWSPQLNQLLVSVRAARGPEPYQRALAALIRGLED